MNLKNYTSSVPVINSISNIEHKLSQAGATQISKFYEDGKPIGIIFTMPQNGMPLNFKLPAHPNKVYDYMIKLRSRPPNKAQAEAIRLQADRTAWRSLFELISIEVDYAMQGQANLIELMLARTIDRDGNTLYERLEKTNFKMLTQ
jgi:hypothetical protein